MYSNASSDIVIVLLTVLKMVTLILMLTYWPGLLECVGVLPILIIAVSQESNIRVFILLYSTALVQLVLVSTAADAIYTACWNGGVY